MELNETCLEKRNCFICGHSWSRNGFFVGGILNLKKKKKKNFSFCWGKNEPMLQVDASPIKAWWEFWTSLLIQISFHLFTKHGLVWSAEIPPFSFYVGSFDVKLLNLMKWLLSILGQKLIWSGSSFPQGGLAVAQAVGSTGGFFLFGIILNEHPNNSTFANYLVLLRMRRTSYLDCSKLLKHDALGAVHDSEEKAWGIATWWVSLKNGTLKNR